METINFPDSLEQILSFAFSNCEKLKNVNLNSNLQSIGEGAFSRCYDITSISFNYNLQDIGDYAFSDCSNLENVSFGDNLKSIGYYSFNNCEKIRNLHIPANVSEINELAFNNCTGVTTFTVSLENQDYSSDGYSLIDKNTNTLIKYIAKGNTTYDLDGSSKGVNYIGENAFENCLLTELSINNVYEIKKYSIKYCNELIKLSLNNINTVKTESVHYCNKLEEVNVYNVTMLEGSFIYGNNVVNEINLKNMNSITNNFFTGAINLLTITNVSEISNNLFASQTTIKEISLSGITTIKDSAFYNSGIEKITINNVNTIEAYAFAYCAKATAVVIDNVVYIGERAFYGNNKLETINLYSINTMDFEVFGCSDVSGAIYADILLDNVSIGREAFSKRSINSLNMQNVDIIGDYAFSWCTGITTVVLPDSVTTIGDYAFSDFNTLMEGINIPGGVETMGTKIFSGTSINKIFVYNTEEFIAQNYTWDSEWNFKNTSVAIEVEYLVP